MKKILKAVGVLFVLMIALLMCVPSDKKTEPTNTSNQATSIEKTDIEKPLETAQNPNLSDADRQYCLEIAANSSKIGDALTKLANAIRKPQMNEQVWVLEVAAQLVIIEGSIKEARQIEPTPKMQSVHTKYMSALDNFQYVVDNLPKGIDNLDTKIIDSCAENLQLGTQHLIEASEEVTAIQQQAN